MRDKLGLRRTEFAAKIGYTHQQLVRIEEGLTPVSDEVRRKISREYRVSEDWLRDGSGDFALEDGNVPRRERLWCEWAVAEGVRQSNAYISVDAE